MLSKCDVYGHLLYYVEQKYKAVPEVSSVVEASTGATWTVLMGPGDTHSISDGTLSYTIRARDMQELLISAKKFIGVIHNIVIVLKVKNFVFTETRDTRAGGPEMVTALFKRVVKKALDAKGV